MDFKLLEDFVSLARMKSFTAASRERHITQSALSRRIRSLEQWLGTDLINRNSKLFALTPQGRVFVTEAEVILRRLYNARETAGILGTDGKYEITVAAQNSIAQTLFLDWARQLEGQLNNIFIRLLSEKLSECVELLNRGDVKYLFCYASESIPLPIDEKRFEFMTIGKEFLVPVTLPDANHKPMYSLPGTREKPLPFIAYARESVFGKAVDHLIQKDSQCASPARCSLPLSRSDTIDLLGNQATPNCSSTSDFRVWE